MRIRKIRAFWRLCHFFQRYLGALKAVQYRSRVYRSYKLTCLDLLSDGNVDRLYGSRHLARHIELIGRRDLARAGDRLDYFAHMRARHLVLRCRVRSFRRMIYCISAGYADDDHDRCRDLVRDNAGADF